MGNILEFKNKNKPPDDINRVEVHVCGVCGSENFWLLAKSIQDDVGLHGIACARCGHQVQGTWQPKP